MRAFLNAFLIASSTGLLCAGCMEPGPSTDDQVQTSFTSQGLACTLYCDSNISRTTPGVGTSSFACETSIAGNETFVKNLATSDCADLGYDVECGFHHHIVDPCFQVGDSTSIQVNGYGTYRCGRIDC